MKTYSHSYRYGKRLNWRAIVISLSIAGCFYLAHLGTQNQTRLATQEVAVEFPKAVEVQVVTKATSTPHKPSKEEMIALIKQNFPRSGDTMVAIAMAESGLDNTKQNWNCYYKGYWKKQGGEYVAVVTDKNVLDSKSEGVISTWCRSVEDRQEAHSVDCFVLMRNYQAKECPNVTLEEHLHEVATMSKRYGFSIWASYTTKTYKQYLTQK